MASVSLLLLIATCSDDEIVYTALNDGNCVSVDVTEEGTDDDDSATDDDDTTGDDDTGDDDSAGDDDTADDDSAGDDDTGDDDSADDDDTGDDDSSEAGDDDSADQGGRADDDSAEADDDAAEEACADLDAWPGAACTPLTCCGGDVVIGEGLIWPQSGPPGENRYARVKIFSEAFASYGYDLEEVARVTVGFDPRDIGTGEVELEQDGLDDTLWDGWIGVGELGGVPRTDELCFELWGEEESSD